MPILGRGQPNPAIIERGSLQDDPVLTTSAPVVVDAPRHPAWLPPPTSPIISRSSLVDVVIPAAATPAPIVIAASARPTPPIPPTISRSSLADVVVAAVATPSPLVLWVPPKPQPAVIIIQRGTLADPPVLTTPGPVVVAAPRWRALTYPVVGRSSLADVAPVVIDMRRWEGAGGSRDTRDATAGQPGALDAAGGSSSVREGDDTTTATRDATGGTSTMWEGG